MAERTKYTVFKANIKDDDGTKVGHGETVELGPKFARHYNNLGYLRPYIPSEDEEVEEVEDDDDDELDDTPPPTTRSPIRNTAL